MRVFMTGAGMIGCHAIDQMAERGDRVTVFDLAPREPYMRRVAGGSDFEVVQGDIRELPALMEAMIAATPEVVVHTAGLIAGAASKSPYRGYQVNVFGTLNVAEAVRLLGVRRLIHASTLGVHDLSQPQEQPIDESFPVGGREAVYPSSKVACELILRTYAATYGFELGVLRFASAYGYGHFAGGSGVGIALQDLVTSALEGRPATKTAPLGEISEYVYAKDLARGVALAVHAPKLPQRVYHLGSGRLDSPQDLIDAVRQAVPGSDPGPIPPKATTRLQPMDISAARRDLGYEPEYDLAAGMRDYVRELRRDA